MHVAQQLEPFLVRAQCERSQRFGDGLAQRELYHFEQELAGFDAREVEHVVDHAEQRAARDLTIP